MIRICLLSVFLFFLPFWASTQNISKIDSLKGLLGSSSEEKRFELLNDIGFAYRLANPDSTIYYCGLAYQLGSKIGLKKGLSKPLSFVGLANAYKGNYKNSFDYHLKAIELAQLQADSIQLAFCYNNFGRLFFDQGDITRAFENLMSALEIFEKIKDPSGLAYVYRSLSNVYKSQNDYSKALEMSLNAYKIRMKIGEPRMLLSALSELGLVYSEMKNLKDAEHCFQQADSIANRVEDFISMAELRMGWAEFLVDNGDINKSDSLAKLAYKTVYQTGNMRLIPRVNLLIGQIQYKTGEFRGAIPFLEKVIEVTSDTHLDLARDAHFYLSKIYEELGMDNEAIQHLNKHLKLKESLMSVGFARQIEKLKFQLEIEKKERENEKLKTIDVERGAVIQRQRIEKIALTTGLVLISAMLIMIWGNNRKRRMINIKLAKRNTRIKLQQEKIARQNAKLAIRNKELSDLNNEKDTLMNIVAHDLKSPLNRIKGLAGLAGMEGGLNSKQKEYLEMIQDSTRSGLHLIVDLLDVNSIEANREPSYSLFDLSSFLQDRVNSIKPYASAKEIEIRFLENNIGSIFLDQDYLERIFDNLVSNAIKFSPPKTLVTVSAEKLESTYFIKVKDQGPGFSDEDKKLLFQKFKKLSARPTAGESSNGLGLAIVKILVDRMNGKIELQSSPEQGSEFTVSFLAKQA